VAVLALVFAASALLVASRDDASDEPRTPSPGRVARPRPSVHRRRSDSSATDSRVPDGPGDRPATHAPADVGPCVVTGRVVDERGRALADVFVCALGASGRIADGRTGDDGGYRFELAGADVFRCAASTADRVPRAGAWTAASPGSAIDGGTLVLVPGAAVADCVRDAQGRAVAGALIRVAPADADAVEAWRGVVENVARTRWECGADGEFAVTTLAPGRYRVEASPDDRCGRWTDARIVVAGGDPITVTLPDDLSPRVLSVRVRAVDEDGSDVLRFRAVLSANGRDDWQRERDGEAEPSVLGVPPFRLDVWARGFDAVRIDGVESRPNPVVVRLARSVDPAVLPAIRGVVEFAGERIKDRDRVRVEAHPLDASDPSTCDDYARAFGGEFTLRPTSRAVRLTARGFVFMGDARVDVDGAVATASIGDANVRIAVRPVKTITATLLLPDGGDGDEASINVADERQSGFSRTESLVGPVRSVGMESLSADGTFDVGVSVRKNGEWMRGVVVRGVVPGGEPIECRFERGLAIEGDVVRADGSAVVAAQVWTDAEPPHFRIATTGLDGRFRLTGLREGWERLRASAPGLRLDGAPVTVEAGGAAVRLVVVSTGP
jgi:hypothetical protein